MSTRRYYNWRDAIRQVRVEPLTKLLCYTIANHLTNIQSECSLSIETLIAETGLTADQIEIQTRDAIDAGLLITERSSDEHDRSSTLLYIALLPGERCGDE